MISRKLPRSVLTFENGSAITLNVKIGSAIAKLAAENAARSVKVFGGTKDVLVDLEKLHTDLDMVNGIVKSLDTELSNLTSAIGVLEGTPTSGMSAIEMVAMQVKAMVDQLQSMQPDAALYEVEETISAMSSAEKALEMELEITRNRCKKLDYYCRQAVGKALEDPSHRKMHRLIFDRYECPEHWVIPALNADSADIHKAAKSELQRDLERIKREKSQNKAEARSELQKNLKELWND